MEQLTKQHFDNVVGGLATKEDITKQTEELARMVKKGFDHTTVQLDEISEKLDVRTELSQLQSEFKTMKSKIGQALHVDL